jgi:ribonucleoside-triphosphate reductase (formate)
MRVDKVLNKANEKKLKFIQDYAAASNAASGSEVDANANVTTQNCATLAAELNKADNVSLHYYIMYKYLTKKYGEELASQFLVDEDNHIIYVHDATNAVMPYCCAISLYPFLLDGLTKLGGTSGAPKHANSFVGGLCNLIFLIAGQFAGAVAVPEFLPYLDHFLRKDYGDNYVEHLDEPIWQVGNSKTTVRSIIYDLFQEFVYCINQPAGARGYQSPFTNIAYFDRGYFESIFKDFVFPDGDCPNYNTTKELEKMFMKWFNKERLKNVLTFPVETANILVDKETHKYIDSEMANFFAEMWAEGHSFFMYQSDSADSLSSCCRLKNAIEETPFSYTLGAGAIMTGSKKVITLNLNRIIQNWFNDEVNKKYKRNRKTLPEYITEITSRVHKYLDAWNDYLWDLKNAGLLSVYDAGYIDLDKQYLTVGINGFIEAAEFLHQMEDYVPEQYKHMEIRPNNTAYKQFAADILDTIKALNVKDRTPKTKFNTEFVPAENAGAKLYKWDKKAGYWVPPQRNLYNSYFYPVEDPSYDPITKMYLHGKDFIKNLDGGSALHCNLDSHLSKAQYRKLMDIAVEAGCSYFTYNIPNTICNKCGHITKEHLDHCEKCGSTDVDYLTRVIGYLKRVSNFSEARQVEANKRYYAEESTVKDEK